MLFNAFLKTRPSQSAAHQASEAHCFPPQRRKCTSEENLLVGVFCNQRTKRKLTIAGPGWRFQKPAFTPERTIQNSCRKIERQGVPTDGPMLIETVRSANARPGGQKQSGAPAQCSILCRRYAPLQSIWLCIHLFPLSVTGIT